MARDSRPVADEVAELHDLDYSTLQKRFENLYRSPPPKRIGRKLLILAIAYEIQRKSHNLRVDRLMARLHAVKHPAAMSPRRKQPIKHAMKPGGRLLREWRGKTYEVYVADDGCYLDGERFRSLSAAAQAITGVKRNGPAFFGLRSSDGGAR